MRVIYDARWLPVDDHFDGIGRYAHELAWAMSRRDDVELQFLVHDPRQAEKLPSKRYLVVNRPDDIFAEWSLPKKLETERPDVVYSPFYLMGFGQRKRSYPLILTIHDLIYFHYRTPPQWLPWYQRAGWRLFNLTKWPTKLLLDKADHVVAVSDSARQEIQDRGITKRPLTTVSNAIRPSNHIHTINPASLDIVYMGTFTPYKNVELLIDTMAALPDMTLHLLSRIPVKRRRELERRARQRAVRGHVVFHNGVSDEQYQRLLAGARCLVSASRLEGFGLPLLEAQAVGVPIAVSDTSIFREVAADSALFFDPDSPSECADAIRQLSDPEISKRYVRRGLENAQRFSWDKSAETAIGICQQLVSDRRAN